MKRTGKSLCHPDAARQIKTTKIHILPSGLTLLTTTVKSLRIQVSFEVTWFKRYKDLSSLDFFCSSIATDF